MTQTPVTSALLWQQLRLAKHPGPFDVNEIGYVCEPIGWSAASFRTFRIYTQCDGDGAVKVTNITVIRSDNRWLLLYPPTGEHITRDAGAGEAQVEVLLRHVALEAADVAARVAKARAMSNLRTASGIWPMVGVSGRQVPGYTGPSGP